jgi:hypothetical protein
VVPNNATLYGQVRSVVGSDRKIEDISLTFALKQSFDLEEFTDDYGN